MERRQSGKIKSIVMEICGCCNAKCLYCLQYRLKKEGYAGEIMSPALFETTLSHLIRLGVVERKDSLGNPTMILLYNWGDPFLHPKLSDILTIVKEKGFKAALSSNFIKRPEIHGNVLDTIASVTLSLSGFSDSTYGRIHGADLKRVLENFDFFYANLRKDSPSTQIVISWHRYRFNEHEFWQMYRYFDRPGICIGPMYAYLNDMIEMASFVKKTLLPERLKQVERDLFLEIIARAMHGKKRYSKNYNCPAWDTITVDEKGELLTCCGFSSYDSEHVHGKVTEMSAEEIFDSKMSDNFCYVCVSTGISRFVYEFPYLESWYWPAGGGLRGKIVKVRGLIGKTLRRLPQGETIAIYLKRIFKTKEFR